MSTCSWSAILDQLQGALRPLIYVLMLTHQGNRRKYRQLRLIRKVRNVCSAAMDANLYIGGSGALSEELYGFTESGVESSEIQHVKRHECGHGGVFIQEVNQMTVGRLEVILLSDRRGGMRNEAVF